MVVLVLDSSVDWSIGVRTHEVNAMKKMQPKKPAKAVKPTKPGVKGKMPPKPFKKK